LLSGYVKRGRKGKKVAETLVFEKTQTPNLRAEDVTDYVEERPRGERFEPIGQVLCGFGGCLLGFWFCVVGRKDGGVLWKTSSRSLVGLGGS